MPAAREPLYNVVERWRSRLPIIERSDPTIIVTLTPSDIRDLARLVTATHWAMGEGYDEPDAG